MEKENVNVTINLLSKTNQRRLLLESAVSLRLLKTELLARALTSWETQETRRWESVGRS